MIQEINFKVISSDHMYPYKCGNQKPCILRCSRCGQHLKRAKEAILIMYYDLKKNWLRKLLGMHGKRVGEYHYCMNCSGIELSVTNET